MKKSLPALTFIVLVAFILNGAYLPPDARHASALAIAGMQQDKQAIEPFILDVELTSTRAFGPRILSAPSALIGTDKPMRIDLSLIGGNGNLEIVLLGKEGKNKKLSLRLRRRNNLIGEATLLLPLDETYRLGPRVNQKELVQFSRILCAMTSVELALRPRSI